MLGVLAFGDSITNGGGELQWGVALQSWALWVARALGLPFTTYAVDGARKVLDRLDRIAVGNEHAGLGKTTLTVTQIKSAPESCE